MNSFGTLFRVSIFGESHGAAIGVTLDGVPPGLALSEADFTADLSRRRSGAKGTTPRLEADEPQLVSGVYQGLTTGAPLTILFRNTNTRSQDYSRLQDVPRPGHADFTASVKYGGFQDPRGGGHFSGRITLPVVAAGVVAKKTLAEAYEMPVRFEAQLEEIGGSADPACWEQLLDQAQKEGDSLGGIVSCIVEGIPAGVGEPFWDSVESQLSHALFAIPGVRGVAFGDGFEAARRKGSEQNDCFAPGGDGSLILPQTNHAGGVNGGITNGNPLVFRVAFKPTSSIAKTQRTFDFSAGEMTDLQVPGRHDTCFALRTPVIVEAMAALVLADLAERAF